MLHGKGQCGSWGAQAFVPALLLTRAWVRSSSISHRQMHVHLAELEADLPRAKFLSRDGEHY